MSKLLSRGIKVEIKKTKNQKIVGVKTRLMWQALKLWKDLLSDSASPQYFPSPGAAEQSLENIGKNFCRKAKTSRERRRI